MNESCDAVVELDLELSPNATSSVRIATIASSSIGANS